MDCTDSIPLGEVKRYDALGLPREVMEMVGPAAQTFAALRALACKTGETFASVAVIADKACLERWTVKRHLQKLVSVGLLKHKGRDRRRTVTYYVSLAYLSANHNAKFAILPRWAAGMLATWAERAVFALVVSRDCLNDTISGGTADGEDVYGRLQYPVTTLAKDCGLSRRSVPIAKASLVKRGLLTVDPAVWWRDELGRCRTMADTLILNPDFQVPEHLIDRSAKMRPEKGNDTLHHGLKMRLAPRKNAPDIAQKCTGGRAEMRLAVNGTLKGTLKSIPKGTASAVFSELDFCKGEESKNAKDIRAIDINERRKKLAEQLQQQIESESA